MKHRRTRKEMKRDSERNYGDMADKTPAEKSRKQMRHRPYAAMMVRAQGQQMGSGDDDG